MIDEHRLRMFLRESNHIEGIDGALGKELPMAARFLSKECVTVKMMEDAVAVFEPGAKLRDKVGMDVRVGSHIAPPGGSEIPKRLESLLIWASFAEAPYSVHKSFETLHPFVDGNGRSGRLLWLWMMVKKDGEIPPLGFLHTIYYQMLAASDD